MKPWEFLKVPKSSWMFFKKLQVNANLWISWSSINQIPNGLHKYIYLLPIKVLVVMNATSKFFSYTSVYDLVLLHVCHFHHYHLIDVQLSLSRYSCLHLGSLHPRIFINKFPWLIPDFSCIYLRFSLLSMYFLECFKTLLLNMFGRHK